MAFKELKLGEIGEGIPRVTVGSTLRGDRSNYTQMCVHLSATLATHIRVRDGEKICLYFGTLADSGWMMIRKGEQQVATKHGHEGSLRVRFSGRRLGVEETHTPEIVKFRMGTTSYGPHVVFMLPPWARAGEVQNG